MKTTLEFNLPEEEYELRTALNGWRFRAVISSVDTLLRNRLKYEGVEMIKIEEVRKLIWDELEANDVNLD